MVFVKKSNFLSSVFFGQIKTEKIVFCYSGQKKSFADQKKEVLKKRQKNRNFPKVSMVFVKKSNFLSSVFFWANQARKDRFGRPDKKECSLNQKKEVLKNDKNRNFPNWIVHGFCQKIDFFYHQCFLGKTSQRGSCFDILDT